MGGSPTALCTRASFTRPVRRIPARPLWKFARRPGLCAIALEYFMHHAAKLAREIADRKRAEEALRDSEAAYRVFFENNPLPGWVCDTKTRRFVAVNEAAIRHYGYSRAEFLALTSGDLELPADS